MSKSNEFYNATMFNLVKVTFNDDSTQNYTYAAHVRHNLSKGDYVLVPTGADEDIFAGNRAHELTRVVRVVAVTDDMDKIPTEYELKHVIQKVNGKVYNRILEAKKRYGI